MVNRYENVSLDLIEKANRINESPGMLGTHIQLIQASGLFAIAAALQENANATREANLQFRTGQVKVKMT